jgi:hypothetical protein
VCVCIVKICARVPKSECLSERVRKRLRRGRRARRSAHNRPCGGTVVLQWCSRSVTVMLQGYSNDVTGVYGVF